MAWESVGQSRPLNFKKNQPSKPILILRLYHIATAESDVSFLDNLQRPVSFVARQAIVCSQTRQNFEFN